MFARYATGGALSGGGGKDSEEWPSNDSSQPPEVVVFHGFVFSFVLPLRQVLSEREKSIDFAAPLRGMMRREMRRRGQARTRRDAARVMSDEARQRAKATTTTAAKVKTV
jgi:hypothetical protein